MGLTIFKIFIWGGISSDTSQGGGGGGGGTLIFSCNT